MGCSGWQYRHWKGSFYPETLRQADWFDHYASVFDTVEINNSFYRLPEAETFARWRTQSPPAFLFAVKASRFLTHMKKLKDAEEPIELFFSRAGRLGRKLGPVLYQLPPRLAPDVDRFERFLEALPARRRHVVEFREPGWYLDEIYALLEKHRVAMCLHDMRGSESPRRPVPLRPVSWRRDQIRRPLRRSAARGLGRLAVGGEARRPRRLRLLQQRLGRSRSA